MKKERSSDERSSTQVECRDSPRRNPFLPHSRQARVSESEVGYVVGTGYGRYKVTFGDTQITEISCHARGATAYVSRHSYRARHGWAGHQGDSRQRHRRGARFLHERHCAAGTGRFLQAAAVAARNSAARTRTDGAACGQAVPISTTCTVFAESEVLSWLGKGKKIEDILLGVHKSIGTRFDGALRRVGVEDQVTFTGGVTKNSAMVQVMNEMLGVQVNVGEEAHMMGALGAALFALDRIRASRAPIHN